MRVRRSDRRQPILTRVSLRNLYSGTARFSGAGPWRMRPEVSYIEPWQGQNQPSYLPSCPIGTQPRCVQTPTTISQSGFCTRWASVCGSRNSLSGTLSRVLDFLLGAVTNEDRPAAPLDRDDLPFGNGPDVDLDRRQGERRRIRVHLIDERPGDRGDADRADRARGQIEEISAIWRFAIWRFNCRSGGQFNPQECSRMRAQQGLTDPLAAARCGSSPRMDAPRRIGFRRAARVSDIRQLRRLFALIPIDVHRTGQRPQGNRLK